MEGAYGSGTLPPPPASPRPPQGDVHFFYPNPPFKDDWKPNTQNFVGISEKKKISNPYSKTRHPYRDREKGVKKGTV